MSAAVWRRFKRHDLSGPSDFGTSLGPRVMRDGERPARLCTLCTRANRPPTVRDLGKRVAAIYWGSSGRRFKSCQPDTRKGFDLHCYELLAEVARGPWEVLDSSTCQRPPGRSSVPSPGAVSAEARCGPASASGMSCNKLAIGSI